MNSLTPKGLPARLIERHEWLVLHNRPGEGVLLKDAADRIEALEQAAESVVICFQVSDYPMMEAIPHVRHLSSLLGMWKEIK